LAGGLLAEDGKPAGSRATKSKRRPITVQEVEKAFRAKSDEARVTLFHKLQRAGEDADRPEIVASLVAGLAEQQEKQAVLSVDLRLEGLLADWPSDDATQALAKFLSAADARVVIIALRSLAESGRSAPWEQVLPVTQRADFQQIFALRRGVVQVAEN